MSDLSPLSQALRSSTRAAHERAHHSSYMDELLGGRLPLDAYALLAEQYWVLYGALEAATDAMRTDPVGRPFVIDELRRVPALRADLEFLRGPGWEQRLTVLPATQAYADRLRTAGTTSAAVHVAHHYTRYLGDLAGGQMVGKLLERTYGITGAGALFYDFAALGSPSAFRTRYRELLDTAPFDELARQQVTDEALHAFELNIALLDELASAVGLPVAA
ncbi:MAG: biliverdin-producing heme oxygenase [Pseudonocardia sp.]|nr:biliverdin-producing heme oxygenase [Pseudonocardia sp.]